MKTIKIVVVTLIFLLVSCKSNTNTKKDIETSEQEKVISDKEIKFFPTSIGYVNDYSKIFDNKQIIELDSIINNYEKRTTNQITIITIDSIKPYINIHKYTVDLANEWGVGQKDKNNGLTIVISKNLRKVAIATGLGTEKTLTDEICQSTIDSIMIPRFKEDKYYEGIKNGTHELMHLWEISNK